MKKFRPTDLPRYDTLAQCSAATGIPLAVIKRAKRAGCGAFKNSRVDLAPLLKFIFTHEVSDIDLPALQAEQVKLQNEKLTAQNSILRREWFAADDVKRWGSELGHSIKLVVERIHQCAPNLEGLPAIEISAALKAKEHEVLEQLSTLGETIQSHEQEIRRDLFQQ